MKVFTTYMLSMPVVIAHSISPLGPENHFIAITALTLDD
jgi:hypothetical protein